MCAAATTLNETSSENRLLCPCVPWSMVPGCWGALGCRWIPHNLLQWLEPVSEGQSTRRHLIVGRNSRGGRLWEHPIGPFCLLSVLETLFWPLGNWLHLGLCIVYAHRARGSAVMATQTTPWVKPCSLPVSPTTLVPPSHSEACIFSPVQATVPTLIWLV